MRVIFGIGNPGSKYQNNRHNVGFLLLDFFAVKNSLSFKPSKGNYYACEGEASGNEYLLVKPSTYVNNSGIAAMELAEKYNLSTEDFLIIHDDINLDIAVLKVKISGSDGGHNGLSSLIYNFSSDKFPRLRIGIGKSFRKGEMAAYVLSDFNDDEMESLTKSFDTGALLIEEFISGGVKNLLDINSRIHKSDKKSEDGKDDPSLEKKQDDDIADEKK